MTQSRMASLIASLSVRLPAVTGTTCAPSNCIRATFSACRCVSSSPMYTTHSRSEQCGRGGGGDTVLTSAGLGDDPGLPHPLGEKRLAEHVVDLVAAGVVEVLTLEQHLRDPELPRQTLADVRGVGRPL